VGSEAPLYQQIIYKSNATRAMTQQDLESLLGECRALNAQHHVTGVLLYVNGYFVQCIEGPPEEIAQLLGNIRRDERNQSLAVLEDIMVCERAFPDWQMGFRVLDVEELRQQEGFMDVNAAEGLDVVLSRHKPLFGIMHAFYTSI